MHGAGDPEVQFRGAREIADDVAHKNGASEVDPPADDPRDEQVEDGHCTPGDTHGEKQDVGVEQVHTHQHHIEQADRVKDASDQVDDAGVLRVDVRALGSDHHVEHAAGGEQYTANERVDDQSIEGKPGFLHGRGDHGKRRLVRCEVQRVLGHTEGRRSRWLMLAGRCAGSSSLAAET